ncbi:hypothetical protein LSAT2_019890 [Lamellibrachia satsuma]|nr:hypothetical protein LSAT2_019890 [Lamellibrachia satsuma]
MALDLPALHACFLASYTRHRHPTATHCLRRPRRRADDMRGKLIDVHHNVVAKPYRSGAKLSTLHFRTDLSGYST